MTTPKCPACGGPISLKLGVCLPCGRPFVAEVDAGVPPLPESEETLVGGRQVDLAEWSAEPRPWIRYFARSIDVVIAVTLGGVLMSFFPSSMDGLISDWSSGLAGLFLWIFIEPLFLAQFGATPGKAVLATRIRTAAGENLPYSLGLERSGQVWLRGLAMGLPLVSLITLIAAYLCLTDGARTSWDNELDTHVEHRPLNSLRVVATAFVLLAVLALRVIGFGIPVSQR